MNIKLGRNIMSLASLRPLVRRRLALCLITLLSGFLPSLLHAQSTWSLVSPMSGSGTVTTATLWGACYGGGQFVAVGERGTILTSPDGLSWTPRTSGTAAWLTSIAYGYNHYVAVGADRTILVSLDAITWTPFTDFTAKTPRDRLNVVGFDRNRFLAYGENNLALSLDLPPRGDWIDYSGNPANTRRWWRAFVHARDRYVVTGETGLAVLLPESSRLGQRQPATVPPSTRALSGIVFDHDTFTAVGDGGVILTSSDAATWTVAPSGSIRDLQSVAAFNDTLVAVGSGGTVLVQNTTGTWTPATVSPTTTQLLLAVAASDTTAIIVGGSGTILRATPTPVAPTFATTPISITETLGGAASFVVAARGSLPLTYQWSRNGTALPGETRADLIRAPLTAADSGTYTVTVANSAGTATSAPATLSLLPSTTRVVDPAFQADASLAGTPTNLLAFPDGSVLVALGNTGRLVKLTSAGALDPSWATNVFGPISGNSFPNFAALALQPDGKIVVAGTFTSHNSQPRTNLLRLQRDGTFDPTFSPATEATTAGVSSLALQSDGKILLANSGPTPLRLLADGNLDASFRPRALPPARTNVSATDLRDWRSVGVSVAPGGAIYASYEVNLQFTLIAPLSNATTIRLLADGTSDPTFNAAFGTGRFVSARALDDGGLLFIAQDPLTTILSAPVRARRYSANGMPFIGHSSLLLPSTIYTFIFSDGRFVATSFGTNSPVRYTALGQIDPSFTGGIGFPAVFAATTNDRLFVAGNFDSYDGIPANHLARLNSVPDDSANAPRILSLTADKTTATYGDTITFRAAVTGSGPLIYDWSGAANTLTTGQPLRTTSPFLSVPLTASGQSPSLQLTVRNHRGEATSARLDFTLTPNPPAFLSQPSRVSAQTGRDLALVVSVNPTSLQNQLQWRRDGVLLPRSEFDFSGLGSPGLNLPSLTAADAGTYTVTVTNALGVSTASAPIVLTIDDSSRFTNLSTRALVAGGTQSAIAGFVITGNRSRTVLIRGIGPGLEQFGVVAPLADPQLTLFDQNGQTIPNRRNDDWSANDDSGAYLLSRFQSLGAFPLVRGSKDSTFLLTLDPGTYTVQLSAPPGQTGTALLELYEADNDAARILNLSTRALVTPAAPAFAGFAIRGPVAKTVLVRAAGPTLAAFGLANPLARPRLTVRDATGTAAATNSSWETAPDRAALLRATSAVGAFAFTPGSNDAALLMTLPPGNYTAVIESTDTTTGIALVEVYELP